MKIDDVAEELYKKYHQLMGESNKHDFSPKLAIYMDYDFYFECLAEINGNVSGCAMDFMNNGVLMGYPVWMVPPRHDRNGQTNHSDFIIVDLDPQIKLSEPVKFDSSSSLRSE